MATLNHSTPQPRTATGIEGLDALLSGGLPSNRLYVVEGNPGAGKTTLALQFLLEGARRGEKTLYITLSETADEVNEVAASHGWSVEGIELLELNSVAERFHENATYTVYHPADVDLEETLKLVRREVERLNPTRVVLDSVSELKILSESNARYRREILRLKQFFAGRSSTVLVLDDRTARETDNQLQSIAHGVICLERLNRDYGTTRRQLHVVKMRGVRFQDGFHDFSICTGGIAVYPRIVPDSRLVRHRADSVRSGVPQIDALLGNGLDRGSSTLSMGPAGSGKSTLCTQFVLAALQRGESAACFLFEESFDTFLTRSAGLGMMLEPYIEEGRLHVTSVDLAGLSPGEFAHRVQHFVEERGVKTILIDSLNGYMAGMPSEKFLLVHMHELLAYLGQKGVITFLVVAQHGMMGAGMQAPVDVSFLADTVMLLRFFEADGAIRQAISVVKKRRGGHERTIRDFRLTPQGIEVGEPLSDFHGIFSGIPQYKGNSGEIPRKAVQVGE